MAKTKQQNEEKTEISEEEALNLVEQAQQQRQEQEKKVSKEEYIAAVCDFKHALLLKLAEGTKKFGGKKDWDQFIVGLLGHVARIENPKNDETFFIDIMDKAAGISLLLDKNDDLASYMKECHKFAMDAPEIIKKYNREQMTHKGFDFFTQLL